MSNKKDAFDELELNQLSEHEITHSNEPVEHEWVQRGNDLECHSCSNPHGHIGVIPNGKMLTKNKEGKFDIVPIPSM